jgi:ribosome recycling factor
MFTFTPDTTNNEFEKAIQPEMDKAIKYLEHEISKLRTGRASTALVEDLRVSAYGSQMAIKELAAISIPDPKLIAIQPWDKSVINEIEKAIQNSDLGINPINDGDIIRIQLPQMSSERRDELLKILSKKLEESKVIVRSARKEFQNSIREADKKKVVSEDFAKRLQDILQKQTDNYIANVDSIGKKKESEIKS